MSEQVLPETWATCDLGEVVATIRGISYAKEQASGVEQEGYLPILRATNIDRTVHFEDFVFVPRSLISSEQLLRPGDIVIAASSGSKTVVGKAAQLSRTWDGSFGAFCMGIRPSEQIEPRFVGHFLQSDEYRHQISKLAAGSNINNLKREHIESFPFRLAPVEEQARISNKVDELLSDLDAGVAALGRARASLKRYRAAVLEAAVKGKLTAQWRKDRPDVEPTSKLLERILVERRRKWEEAQIARYAAVGKAPPPKWKDKYPEPAVVDTDTLPELPGGWCWTTFDTLFVSGPQNGLYMPQSAYGTGMPILRIDDFQNDWSRSVRELRVVNVPINDVDGYALQVGDIVVNRVNSPSHLGKCLVIEDRHVPALFESNLMRIGCSELCFPDYVVAYFRSVSGKQRLTANAKWAVNQASINQRDVALTPVAIPPLAEQREIVSAVAQALSSQLRAELEFDRSRARASRLRQSILKRAFEGKLVPQDPNDEPASVLLDRIRHARGALLQDVKRRDGKRRKKERISSES